MRTAFKVALSLGLIIILMVAINGFNETRASPKNTTVALYDSAQIGVVSRVLNLSLEKGINRVPLDELAGTNVEEITIRPLNEGVQFLGLYSEESSENIYDSNVGSDVEVKTSDGNVIKGKFLGMKNGQLIIQNGGNLYAINPAKIAYFKASRIEKRGGVYASFLAEKAGIYPVEITYRVQGMNWKMRYKLYLSNDTAKLIGYVLLSNPTSQEFDGAKVALVSGDVNFYSGSPRYLYNVAATKEGAVEVPVQGPEKVEAFYVYSLGSVDIRPASTMLFPYIASEVRVKREYLYESWAYGSSGNAYESVSFEAEHVLPAGVVEIYRENGEGTLLIGESHIEHTPKGDIVRIGIGKDYDLKGKTEVLQRQSGDHYAYYKIRITVQNFGDEGKTVIVRHYKYRGKLKSSSVAPSRDTYEYVEFTLNIPAGGSNEVTFDYEVNW
ncbi:DUF4139 domain-containing protein [Thermococcus sp. Bubb.Bath]|uniref:DUF4139 domain-containing protein n=1 Tax=Thermococcus sp. Bubb.Bath TaxID=1638242 RepID=UPI00143B9DB2|nr:DUF4139 domain-containing protein [Thermococcus sp. Bubb.Bath]NJF24284.1 DUF4139 domain-containing protein [Thermococcus sp. Bubb.Bath]